MAFVRFQTRFRGYMLQLLAEFDACVELISLNEQSIDRNFVIGVWKRLHPFQLLVRAKFGAVFAKITKLFESY